MNKQEIYNLLRSRGLWFEVTEHEAVFDMAGLAHIDLPYPQADAKNLFVRDDRKQRYFLLTVPGNRRVDLRAFRSAHGTRSLSFASPEELLAILGLTPGAVTPLGLLHDTEHRAELFVDESFTAPPGIIGVHPNDNTATVWMQTADLIALLREQGCSVHITTF